MLAKALLTSQVLPHFRIVWHGWLLVEWQYQTGYQGNSWRRTIKEQRRGVLACLQETPSLKPDLGKPDWWAWVWSDAVGLAVKETGLDGFPESCPWTIEQITDAEFWP